MRSNPVQWGRIGKFWQPLATAAPHAPLATMPGVVQPHHGLAAHGVGQ
jgi:hypothetical protein